jgi:YesN/AraC family two-component response regulator
MKLKAVLVDDELPILHNLSNVLPWERWDIELVALARNGVEALAAVREHHPDILLSDIRMPVMDGMELLAEVREFSEECEILMLTGYQEFEYARTALQYKVRDYILKPIDYDKLGETVEKLAGDIRARKLAMRLSEDKRRRSASLVYDKLVHDVALGLNPEEARQPLLDAGIAVDRLHYDLLLVEAAVEEDSSEELEAILRESPSLGGVKPLVLKLGEAKWLLLLDQENPNALPEAVDPVTQMTASGSTQVTAWLGALSAMVLEKAHIRVQARQLPGPVPFHRLPQALEELRRNSGREQPQDRRTGGSLLTTGAADGAAMTRKRGERLIGKAGDYIRRNLSSDIGIEEVASHLGISCSYFSMLFKAHFGETFVEHVTRQRMERAMALLLTSDKSITRIGMSVGYAERRYFTKVFQKYAHVTPSEYREAGRRRIEAE